VHGEIKKIVVTSMVKRHFIILQGVQRDCVDFCDPAAVSRFNTFSLKPVMACFPKPGSTFPNIDRKGVKEQL